MSEPQQHIRVEEPQCAQCNGSEQGTELPPLNAGRMELVILNLHLQGSIRLLAALHDNLPSQPEPVLREALIRLLVPDERKANAYVADHTTMPRDLLLARHDELDQKHRDLQELLHALPLQMPTEGADRALKALVTTAVL